MKDGASAQQLASNVSRAEKELIDAQRALEDLNSASPLSLAQAEKDLAQAKDALDKAQDDLSNLINPDLDYYQRQLNKAQDALELGARANDGERHRSDQREFKNGARPVEEIQRRRDQRNDGRDSIVCHGSTLSR